MGRLSGNLGFAILDFGLGKPGTIREITEEIHNAVWGENTGGKPGIDQPAWAQDKNPAISKT